jgi:hypothetical protein
MWGLAIFCRRHSSTSSCHFVFENSTRGSPRDHQGPSPSRRAHPAFLTRLCHLSPSLTACDSVASSHARHDPATPLHPAPLSHHLLAGASPAVQGSCPCSIGRSGAHPEVQIPSPASKQANRELLTSLPPPHPLMSLPILLPSTSDQPPPRRRARTHTRAHEPAHARTRTHAQPSRWAVDLRSTLYQVAHLCTRIEVSSFRNEGASTNRLRKVVSICRK